MITWKDVLQDRMPEDLAHDIDIFEGQMALRQQDKLDEKVFAETRLRRGVYGQRYDNGQRHDGVQTQTLNFPSVQTKGPDTLWDAPGMQRIKVPFGGLSIEQMETLAELADEYSDGVLHVTTRQDFQLHYVHIEDTPDLMRRLAAVGLTTQEACGNSVRNVTACPLAGVCHDEAFDVTPKRLRSTCSVMMMCRTSDASLRLPFPGVNSMPAGWCVCMTLAFWRACVSRMAN
jgi:sulfite reductase (ferredoxin)